MWKRIAGARMCRGCIGGRFVGWSGLGVLGLVLITVRGGWMMGEEVGILQRSLELKYRGWRVLSGIMLMPAEVKSLIEAMMQLNCDMAAEIEGMRKGAERETRG